MLGEEKRSIINVNLKRYLRQIQHSITDFKMELLAKLVNDFKCFLRTTKELYHGFLEWWLLLPSRDFTCSKSTIETLKTLEHNVKCV